MRNLDPNRMFYEMALRHRPKFRFDGGTVEEFTLWQQEALPAVINCLGDFPEKVPPNPELIAEWQERGIRVQRWFIDVHPFLAATLLVNYPADLKPARNVPPLCAGTVMVNSAKSLLWAMPPHPKKRAI